MKVSSELFASAKENMMAGIANSSWLVRSLWKTLSKKVVTDVDLSSAIASTSIRVSEDYMPEHYQSLCEICDKLGIEVPYLYLKNDVDGVADIFLADHGFIVFNSDYFNSLPSELVKTAIARECSHFFCMHAKGRSMSNLVLRLLNKVDNPITATAASVLNGLLNDTMCNSERVADRVAMVVNGSSKEIIELVCFDAGYPDYPIPQEFIDSYIKQAKECREKTNNYKNWNKLKNSGLVSTRYPLYTERILQALEFEETEAFKKIVYFLDHFDEAEQAPIAFSSKTLVGKDAKEFYKVLVDEKFSDVTMKPKKEGDTKDNGKIVEVSIGRLKDFEAGNWYNRDAHIEIIYK